MEHKLSPAEYLRSLGFRGITFISSPEIGFLKSIGRDAVMSKTKLIFEFKDPEAMEPTTNKKYSEILQNLAAIKAFASGVLVPKGYIWPIDSAKYLKPATTLVADAHKAGLEVYASGFANDMPASFNYSYDPSAEYLQFVDNGQFSVDGFITDFPPTASQAICEMTCHPPSSYIYVSSRTWLIREANTPPTFMRSCSLLISPEG